jgi:hypothetical protein
MMTATGRLAAILSAAVVGQSRLRKRRGAGNPLSQVQERPLLRAGTCTLAYASIGRKARANSLNADLGSV